MNRIYRLVWNAALNLWVAVAENAKGKSKGGSARTSVTVGDVGLSGSGGFTLNSCCRAAAALLGAMLWATSPVHAGPAGGVVSAGSGSIAQTGTTTTINQTSPRLAIDWNTFSTAAGESVMFLQPNAQAIALNRVLSSRPTEFLGSLSANGQVFILNPNGVLFGAGSQVNVGGLVASTLSMSNADFMAGNNVFTKDATASVSVINRGALTAANGGYLALLAPEVRNEGVMSATLGTALLAAGNKVTLTLNNGSLIGYSIDQGAINALAANKQLIQANGGQVILSAKAADALSTAVVNNTGVIEAKTLQNQSGRIMLMGDMAVGQANVAGKLDASAPNGGNGGFIETSAAHVKVADGAVITTLAASGKSGTWLIDPLDYTIAAVDPGNGSSYMSNATLSSRLGAGNVSITTAAGTGNGDIFVNGAVSWNAPTKLTLSAARNININQSITAQNATGSVALEYGQAALASGNTAVYNVNAPVNLQAGNNFTTKLGSNGSVINGSLINYKVITSLGAAGSTTGIDLQGIVGNLGGNYVLGSNIDASATTGWNRGAGFAPIGNGTQFTGKFDGLGHTISNLTINRPSNNYVGLFGLTGSAGVIKNVGLIGGSTVGQFFVGALSGWSLGSIINSYATGSVSGSQQVGGLVGRTSGGSITSSYASGNVSGNSSFTGGLIGANQGVVNNAYAMGKVSGAAYVGGLMGYNDRVVTNTYAKGSVSGTSFVGGFSGYNLGSISQSYWDTTTSGQSSGFGYSSTGTAGATGKTTAEMQQAATFAGWDIDAVGGTGKVWRIYEGHTAPLLRSFLTGLAVANSSATYNGATQNGAAIPTNGTRSGTAASGLNVGSYSAYSNQQGYDISGGSLTINPFAVNLTGTRVYDGTTHVQSSSLVIGSLVGNETLNLSGVGTTANKNVGTAKTLSLGTLALSNGTGLASNYSFSGGVQTADITKRALTVSATGINKVYDGNTTAGVTLADNRVTNDGLSLTDSANFDTKNVGTGKAVSVTGISVTGTDAGNYTYNTTASTTADIKPMALTVTANNDSKKFDNKPYSGGNGVTYTGLVSGETSADVGGTLVYGGSSQGVVALGSYVITPSGLGGNYAPTFVDGQLLIAANSQSTAALGGTALVNAYESVLQNESTLAVNPRTPQQPEAALRKKDNSLVNIVNCGVLMPRDVNLNSCE